MSPTALVDAMRDQATKLGPDISVSWALLETAATLELSMWCGLIPPSSSS